MISTNHHSSKPSLMLVTGAGGFAGSALLQLAHQRSWAVRGATRNMQALAAGVECVPVGDMGMACDWSAALRGCDTVVHLAARVHVMKELSNSPLEAFCRSNALATAHLARSAAAAGVRRLVFASTIKVLGEATKGNMAYSESDVPAPQDLYALSKWQAELALHQVASKTGLEIVIVRPPLVYGPGVRGNFLQMLKAIEKQFPMPFYSVCNKRHLLHVGNFADALLLCAAHPLAAGNSYLLADDAPLSTPQLLSQLASAMETPIRQFLLPLPLLRLAGTLAGQSAALDRLLGSLQVNSSCIRQTLGWNPPYTVVEGLQDTAAWYRSNRVC